MGQVTKQKYDIQEHLSVDPLWQIASFFVEMVTTATIYLFYDVCSQYIVYFQCVLIVGCSKQLYILSNTI